MKKFALLLFAMVINFTAFANETVTEQEATDALITATIPLEIGVPDQLLTLNDLFTGDYIMDVLKPLLEAVDALIGFLIPDVVELDILGIPGGLTIITGGADVDAWGVLLTDAAFNAILGSEGSTISLSWNILNLVEIELAISVIGM